MAGLRQGGRKGSAAPLPNKSPQASARTDRHGLYAVGADCRHDYAVLLPDATQYREPHRPFQKHRWQDLLHSVTSIEGRDRGYWRYWNSATRRYNRGAMVRLSDPLEAGL